MQDNYRPTTDAQNAYQHRAAPCTATADPDDGGDSWRAVAARQAATAGMHPDREAEL
jgi:hypothetical protein